jgi:hypothetical protein
MPRGSRRVPGVRPKPARVQRPSPQHRACSRPDLRRDRPVPLRLRGLMRCRHRVVLARQAMECWAGPTASRVSRASTAMQAQRTRRHHCPLHRSRRHPYGPLHRPNRRMHRKRRMRSPRRWDRQEERAGRPAASRSPRERWVAVRPEPLGLGWHSSPWRRRPPSAARCPRSVGHRWRPVLLRVWRPRAMTWRRYRWVIPRSGLATMWTMRNRHHRNRRNPILQSPFRRRWTAHGLRAALAFLLACRC